MWDRVGGWVDSYLRPDQFLDHLTVITRPSASYAKDWLDHSLPFPCLVWSGKGFHFGCDHSGGYQQPFSCVLGHFWHGDEQTNKNKQTNNQVILVQACS